MLKRPRSSGTLAAPLLVTVGFTLRAALLLAIVGNAGALPFGAIGTPMAPLPEAAGLEPEALSLAAVLLNASMARMLLYMPVRIATADRARPGRACGAIAPAGGMP